MSQPSFPPTELFPAADRPTFAADDRPYQPPYHPEVIFRSAEPEFDDPPTSFEPAHRRRTPRWLIGVGAILIVMVLGCVGALALLGFGAKSVSETITRNADTAKRDITISACRVDPATGFMSASVAILNHGTDQASYLIDIAFTSVDGKRSIDSAVVAADSLPAGASKLVEATTLTPAKGAFTCAVGSVTKI